MNSQSAQKQGFTSSQFLQGASKHQSMIWKLGGLALFCLVLYLGTMFYPKEDGEALERNAATKTELKELQQEVKENRQHTTQISQKLHGIEIKQEMHTQQLDRAVGILEEIARQNRSN